MGSKDALSRKKTRKKKPQDTPEERDSSDSDTEDFLQQFQEKFPHLAAEIVKSDSPVQIDGVRWEDTDRTKQPIRTGDARFAGYSPDIVDFLRRCATAKEALDIIDFMEKRKEIKPAHAKALREQLHTQGLQSFGSRKTWGHYEREQNR